MDLQKIIEQTQNEQNTYQALFQKNTLILELAAELLMAKQEKADAPDSQTIID